MTEDTSPENLRKFLESDDPALVMMGISMAKGAGITLSWNDLEPFLESWEHPESVKLEIMLKDEDVTGGIASEYLNLKLKPIEIYHDYTYESEEIVSFHSITTSWEDRTNLLKVLNNFSENFPIAKDTIAKTKKEIYEIIDEMIENFVVEYEIATDGMPESIAQLEDQTEYFYSIPITNWWNTLKLICIIGNEKDKTKLTKIIDSMDEELAKMFKVGFEAAIEKISNKEEE